MRDQTTVLFPCSNETVPEEGFQACGSSPAGDGSRLKKQQAPRDWVRRILLCGLLGVFTAYTARVYSHTREEVTGLGLSIPLWTAFFILASLGVRRLYGFLAKDPWGGRLRPYFRLNKKNIFRLAVVFAAVYLVWLFVYQPGVCGADTCNQIKDLVTGKEPLPFGWHKGQTEVEALMNDHHPVFTTLIFTLFYEIGAVTGHYNLGIFLYGLVQILCMSLLFAYTLCRMTEDGMPAAVTLAGAVFYCMPFIAYFAISMLKDAMFAVVFTAWFLTGVQLRKRDTDGQGSSSRWALFIVLSVLIALTNKKGMYIAFISGICMIPIFHTARERIRALLSAVLPAAVIIVLLGKILFPLFDIYPGGRQESLGFAVQQTTYTYICHPESFTEEDKDVLNAVLVVRPEGYANQYTYRCTDTQKDQFRFSATDEQVSAYIRLWVKMAFRHPLDYARASLMVNGGFFVPGREMAIYTAPVYYQSLKAFRQTDRNKSLRNLFTGAFKKLCSFPLTSIFFSNFLYTWWMPLAVLQLLLENRRFAFLPYMVPVAANILFLILGPVCWTRYGLCQIYILPVLWGLPFCNCVHADKK